MIYFDDTALIELVTQYMADISSSAELVLLCSRDSYVLYSESSLFLSLYTDHQYNS